MSDEEIDKAVKEAAEYEAQDKKRKEGIDAKNDADSMVFQTEKAMEEVGDKIAGSIREYLADPVNLRIVERLRAAGVQFAADEEQRLSDSLAGLHIVISGTFRRHSRDELKALIESHGGRNLAAVSKNADYLLAGDNMGPAKLAKATKLGVRIIAEEDFERMVEEGVEKTAAERPMANGEPTDGIVPDTDGTGQQSLF